MLTCLFPFQNAYLRRRTFLAYIPKYWSPIASNLEELQAIQMNWWNNINYPYIIPDFSFTILALWIGAESCWKQTLSFPKHILALNDIR